MKLFRPAENALPKRSLRSTSVISSPRTARE